MDQYRNILPSLWTETVGLLARTTVKYWLGMCLVKRLLWRYVYALDHSIFLGKFCLGEVANAVSDTSRWYTRAIEASDYGMIQTLRACLELGVEEVSVFAFSIENYKRAADEVHGLMKIAAEKLRELLKHEYEVSYGNSVWASSAFATDRLPATIAMQRVSTSKSYSRVW
jgi:hypothetical protein